jgi:hypothetical protein
MQPIVNGLQADFAGRLVVERLDANTDMGRNAMNAYGLRGHPSYALVDSEGTVQWTSFGPLSVEQLRQFVESYVKAP